MKKFFLVAVGMVLILTSCEKEVIIEGPPGPQGEAGNANIRSGTYQVAEWLYDEPHYLGEIEVSFITEDVITNGAVLVYAKTSENSYSQLPLTFFQYPDYSTTIEVVSAPGRIGVYWFDSNFTQPGVPFINNFKIIAMESSEFLTKSDIDLTDYEGLKEVFNLN